MSQAVLQSVRKQTKSNYFTSNTIARNKIIIAHLGCVVGKSVSMSNGPKKWSRVNFVTIFGDLYKIKLWGICNNFNQFAHLSSASGPSNDVIKMAAIAQL